MSTPILNIAKIVIKNYHEQIFIKHMGMDLGPYVSIIATNKGIKI